MPAQLFKKALFWVQKTLETTGERTALPNHVDDLVRPALDALGWLRLGSLVKAQASNPAPATTVFFPVVPSTVEARIVVYAACSHSDPAVTHNPFFVWRPATTTATDVALPSDRREIVVGEQASMLRAVVLRPGDFFGASAAIPLVGGSITVRAMQIDVPLGEYIPHLP